MNGFLFSLFLRSFVSVSFFFLRACVCVWVCSQMIHAPIRFRVCPFHKSCSFVIETHSSQLSLFPFSAVASVRLSFHLNRTHLVLRRQKEMIEMSREAHVKTKLNSNKQRISVAVDGFEQWNSHCIILDANHSRWTLWIELRIMQSAYAFHHHRNRQHYSKYSTEIRRHRN